MDILVKIHLESILPSGAQGYPKQRRMANDPGLPQKKLRLAKTLQSSLSGPLAIGPRV